MVLPDYTRIAITSLDVQADLEASCKLARLINIAWIRVHARAKGMNGSGYIVKLSAVSLTMLVIGLIVGFQIGAIFSSSHGPPEASTTTVLVTTRSRFQAPADLVEYCFSPGGNCANVVVKWIERANSSIHVLIYSFTLDAIRSALIDAKNRGVDVKVVMERSNAYEQGAEYQNLKNVGVDIRLDTNSGLMHDKVAIIDGHIILTGSYNWSAAANTSNNENLVVLESTAWASAFGTEFQQVYNQATP